MAYKTDPTPSHGSAMTKRILRFGLVCCLSLPSAGLAQAATASRDARATINRSTDMPEMNRVDTNVDMPLRTPATRTTEDTSIRPFRVHFSDEALADMKRRIKATRYPPREIVSDQSQGVQLATIQKIADYWANNYDWRKTEAKLNSYPNFITNIDGVDIHFIQVKSKEKNALPIIITHGWPGSFIEQMKVIDPLTNPTKFGGNAADA